MLANHKQLLLVAVTALSTVSVLGAPTQTTEVFYARDVNTQDLAELQDLQDSFISSLSKFFHKAATAVKKAAPIVTKIAQVALPIATQIATEVATGGLGGAAAGALGALVGGLAPPAEGDAGADAGAGAADTAGTVVGPTPTVAAPATAVSVQGGAGLARHSVNI